MKSKIQKARLHYATLSPHIKERATAQHLLAAIQIAESRYSAEEISAVGFGDLGLDIVESINKRRTAIARVTKPEGEKP